MAISVKKLIGSALIERNGLRQSEKVIVKQESVEGLLTSNVQEKFLHRQSIF